MPSWVLKISKVGDSQPLQEICSHGWPLSKYYLFSFYQPSSSHVPRWLWSFSWVAQGCWWLSYTGEAKTGHSSLHTSEERNTLFVKHYCAIGLSVCRGMLMICIQYVQKKYSDVSLLTLSRFSSSCLYSFKGLVHPRFLCVPLWNSIYSLSEYISGNVFYLLLP